MSYQLTLSKISNAITIAPILSKALFYIHNQIQFLLHNSDVFYAKKTQSVLNKIVFYGAIVSYYLKDLEKVFHQNYILLTWELLR